MYFLVYDFIPNDSLKNYYFNQRLERKSIDQDFIMKIFKQSLTGLIYLHGNNIMHRNIELNSIILDENYNIKLSDFKFSAIYRENYCNELNNYNFDNLMSNFTKIKIKADFVSPEIINQNDDSPYDFKIDIFSLGLTFLCIE